MKNITVILIAMISISLAEMPGNLKFGGYVENNSSIMFGDKELITNNSILRLEGAWNYKDRGGIETHILLSKTFAPIDFNYAYKKGSLMESMMNDAMGGIMSSLPEMDSSLTSILEDESLTNEFSNLLDHLPYSTFYPSDQITLDRAVLKMYFKPFDLFIGRQTIAWGTGYGFNPTDIFNVKNPMDPKAAKSGVNALRVEVPFGDLSGLSLVAVPDRDFQHMSGGFRLKGNLGNFDLSVCGIKQMNSDLELAGLPTRIIAGADLAGQIGDVGIWLEGAAINPVYKNTNYTDFDSIYAQIDAGIDYTFVNGIYLMAEYYYNGLGEKDYKDYNISGLINQMMGQMSGFGQHYLMAGFTKDFLDFFLFSTFGLVNFTDQSAMILPALDYTFSDNISLKLQGQIAVGDKKKSEYGSMNSSVSFNVTGYF